MDRNIEECPAFCKTCSACEKDNHFASVCISARIHIADSRDCGRKTQHVRSRNIPNYVEDKQSCHEIDSSTYSVDLYSPHPLIKSFHDKYQSRKEVHGAVKRLWCCTFCSKKKFMKKDR